MLKKLKIISYKLFLIYLIILPLIDHLNYKIYGKIGIDNIFLILIVTISLLSLRKVSFKIRVNTPYVAFISIFFIAFFLPTFSSVIYGNNPNPHQLTMGLRFIQVILIVCLANYFIKDWQDFKKITNAYLIGALIAVIFGLGQALNIDAFWEFAEKYYVYGKPHLGAFIRRRKTPSLFGETGNTFGAYMTMSSILIMGIGSFCLKKYLKCILGILFFIGLLISLSVTSMIAFSIAIIAFIFLSSKNIFLIKKSYMNFLILFFLGFLLISPFFYGKIRNRFIKKFRVTSESTLKLRGLKGRDILWGKYWLSLKDRSVDKLLFGIGYSQSGIADNYYIELMSAGGIISFLIFVTLLVFLYISYYHKFKLFRKKSEKIYNLYLTTLVMLIALSVMCMTGSYLGYLPVSVPIAILVVGAKNLNKLEVNFEDVN